MRTFNVSRLISFVFVLSLASIAHSDAVVLEPFASGFERPVQLVSSHDGSRSLFVAQQNGLIIRVTASGSRATFLDLSPVVSCCDNGGLLSVVFDPRFVSNRRLYVQYVNLDGDTAIARVEAPLETNNALAPGGLDVLMTIDQPKDEVPNHHGGTLQFGPDGFLYASIGDGGAYVRVTNRAQQTDLLLGKLLRIDVNRNAGYSVPFDNPYAALPGVRPEIWSIGLRNPWRFSFDRRTGELLLADVGQDSWEEVNVVSLSESKGANFGWPLAEGRHCYPPSASCSFKGLAMPQLEYPHTSGCSVTGGFRYRGAAWPQWTGMYFYGDFCSGKLWMAEQDSTGAWLTRGPQNSGRNIVSFGEDDDGELYLVDYQGTIYKMEPVAQRRRATRK